MRPWGSQIWHPRPHNGPFMSCYEQKGTRQTLYWDCRPALALLVTPRPLTLTACPRRMLEHTHKPSLDSQNTFTGESISHDHLSNSVRVKIWSSLFHSLDESCAAPPESEGLQFVGASPSTRWNKLFQGGWEPWSLESCSTLTKFNSHEMVVKFCDIL